MAAARLELDEQLCFALYAASRAMTQAYRPALDAIGLTYPQYLVMMVLWAEDDVPLKHLGRRLMLDSGTLTPLVKRLQARGLLVRGRDPEDERRTRLRLTTAGRALEAEAHAVPESLLCHMTDPEELAELAALKDTLDGLTRRLRALVGTKCKENDE